MAHFLFPARSRFSGSDPILHFPANEDPRFAILGPRLKTGGHGLEAEAEEGKVGLKKGRFEELRELDVKDMKAVK